MEDKPDYKRALVVEDQAMFRDILAGLIHDRIGFSEVDQAGSLSEARALFEPDRYELVSLDLDLPDGDGLDLAKEFTDADPHLRVVAISAQNDSFTLNRVLESGAMAFVDKCAEGVDRMEQALRDAMDWRMYFSRSIHEAQMADRKNPKSFRKLLTDKEIELMRYFGMGLRNEEIAPDVDASVATVQGHRKSIMRKLEISSSLQLMRYALEEGFTRVSDIHRRPVED